MKKMLARALALLALLALLPLSAALAQNVPTLPYMGGSSGNCFESNGTANPPSFSSTCALPDGSAWSPTGLAQTATVTSASTTPFNWAPNWTFTNLAGNTYATIFNPTMTNTTGTVVAGIGEYLGMTVGTSAQNFTSARVLNIQLNTVAGYSGTIANGSGVAIQAPSNLGSNFITSYTHLTANGGGLGNGLTTGTVTNRGILAASWTGAAGAGGTVLNFGVEIDVPSGTGNAAGTTQNFGLYINGNGGTTGAGNVNYSLYNNSTAPSFFVGPLNLLGYVSLQQVGETYTAPAISSGAITFDLSLGTIFNVSLNANITSMTISNPVPSRASTFTVVYTADGTPRTITYAAAVKWPAGTAPTPTSTNGKKDIVTCTTNDAGVNFYCVSAGQNF